MEIKKIYLLLILVIVALRSSATAPNNYLELDENNNQIWFYVEKDAGHEMVHIAFLSDNGNLLRELFSSSPAFDRTSGEWNLRECVEYSYDVATGDVIRMMKYDKYSRTVLKFHPNKHNGKGGYCFQIDDKWMHHISNQNGVMNKLRVYDYNRVSGELQIMFADQGEFIQKEGKEFLSLKNGSSRKYPQGKESNIIATFASLNIEFGHPD